MAKKGKNISEESNKNEKKSKFNISGILGIFKKIPLKNFSIKKIIEFLKDFKNFNRKKKIIFISSVLAIILLIILLIIIVPTFSTKKLNVESQAESASISNLFIYVPPDAFQYKKTFTIKSLKENSAEYQNLKTLGNLYGPIYEIIPDDKKDESSLKPIKIKYKLPMELYYGDSFNNFSIVYASDDNPPVVKKLAGCEIYKDESLGTYVVQANTFHFSKFGLYVDPNPKEVDFGLKTLIEKPSSLEPDIILVPGIDNNFLGFIPNTQTINNIYGENIWSLYFPNRTIWNYKYPLLETKPKKYMDAFFGYYIRTGSNSYLEFEAERFALELKAKKNKQFDIITQGIGGLIVRYALEKHPEITNVRTITMFSPPNNGINIVNPIYYNVIYKKSPEIIELTYGLNKEEYNSLYLNITSKLELISSYYKELLPDSEFIKKLKNSNIRKDIEYNIITGTIPDINIHISNTKLSTFYPEFIKGYGDGLVTIDSARINGANFYTYDMPYNKLYSDNDVLSFVQSILSKNIEKVDIPKIEDDKFPETTIEVVEKIKSEEKSKENRTIIFQKNSKYTQKELLEFKEELLYLENINYGKIVNLNNNIIILTNKGAYDLDGNNIFNKNILGSIKYKDRLYIASDDGVYAIDESAFNFIKIKNKDFELHNNVYYLPEIRRYIYVDYVDGLANIYENETMISEGSQFISMKVINNEFYIILGNKILKRKGNNWITIVNKAGIEALLKEEIGNFVDYYSRAYLIYLLTSDYKLIIYDTKNEKVQILGNSDVGKLKLLENNNLLWIFDKNYITYIDLNNKVFGGDYQSILDFDIIDVENYNNSFLIFIRKNGGFELWDTIIKK
ncbi:hypothetical protein [Marinitoga sp. 38H-ov]|uniref:hypothetical protein n=1 Tax=Marinitoga sp. 38H-ov TaxID=1755814 RepID=UPI0013ED8B92|nr:hypothetical protein [Marinitoga sp. 38H-ov]KAF2955089.1 hypothetical protein AS160_02320 [Marinitoga sp. 38H-ov]